MKYKITRGYINVGSTRILEDGTKIKEEGGFVEDWLSGHLWVFIGIPDDGSEEIGYALRMDLRELQSDIREYFRKLQTEKVEGEKIGNTP